MMRFLFLSIFVGLFLINYFVYGAWNPEPQTAPQQNPAIPLNVGPFGQTKSGGLILNSDGTADYGLVVSGTSASDGKVGVGTNNPQEKLDITQNLQVDGFLKVNGIFGYPWGSVLRRSAADMQWGNPVAWLTLIGDIVPGTTCSGANPPPACSNYGLKTFQNQKDICDADDKPGQDNDTSYLRTSCYQ